MGFRTYMMKISVSSDTIYSMFSALWISAWGSQFFEKWNCKYFFARMQKTNYLQRRVYIHHFVLRPSRGWERWRYWPVSRFRRGPMATEIFPAHYPTSSRPSPPPRNFQIPSRQWRLKNDCRMLVQEHEKKFRRKQVFTRVNNVLIPYRFLQIALISISISYFNFQ